MFPPIMQQAGSIHSDTSGLLWIFGRAAYPASQVLLRRVSTHASPTRATAARSVLIQGSVGSHFQPQIPACLIIYNLYLPCQWRLFLHLVEWYGILSSSVVGKGQPKAFSRMTEGPCPPERRAAYGYIFRSDSNRHFNRWYLQSGLPDMQKEMTAGVLTRAAIIST